MTALLSVLLSKKKIEAETDKAKSEAKKVENEAYIMLIKPLQDSIIDLKTKVNILEIELKVTLAHNSLLTNQLCKEGITPVPAPTIDDLEKNKKRK